MKVLFLDDDVERTKRAIEYFKDDELFLAQTAQESIDILDKESPFDLVHLDHDLGGQVYCPSDEVSGAHVARHIVSMPDDKCPSLVVVHSHNPAGAKNMVETLRDYVRVVWQPFSIK